MNIKITSSLNEQVENLKLCDYATPNKFSVTALPQTCDNFRKNYGYVIKDRKHLQVRIVGYNNLFCNSNIQYIFPFNNIRHSVNISSYFFSLNYCCHSSKII